MDARGLFLLVAGVLLLGGLVVGNLRVGAGRQRPAPAAAKTESA
ncbi:hypothetical protein [Streptomonospora alba]|nr:hypothetical protein [Streptomonospora alba]